MMHIIVTENGSGRIDFNTFPANIGGLCIKGLTTCTSIVIIGDKGISVVHDEGFSSIDSIEKEFEFVGNLHEWAIFYNPNFLKNGELTTRIREMNTLIQKFRSQYKITDKHFVLSKTESGELCVNRETKQISDVILKIEDSILIQQPALVEVRNAIRYINNLCAYYLHNFQSKLHRQVPLDIQFVNQQNSDAPRLICVPDEIPSVIRQIALGEKKFIEEYTGYLTLYLSHIKQNAVAQNDDAHENNGPSL